MLFYFSSSPSAGPIKPPQNAFHQWIYHDGFIQLKANRKLVIGVQQSDEVFTTLFITRGCPLRLEMLEKLENEPFQNLAGNAGKA